MKLKSIRQLKNLKNKVVLVRVDYNVSIKDGKVSDTERIERSYATINYLLKKKAKVVLMSHLGRPNGHVSPEFSLKIVVKYLNKITKKKVSFVDDCIGEKVQKEIARLKVGQILLLENLRFYDQEEKNEAKFAQQLGQLADIYVNEAFSNSHRQHASMSGVTKYLPSYAGINLENEIDNLDHLLKGYKRPAVAVIGGVKISTKIKVLENLLKKYDYVLIGGALANNFYASQNINIGKSICEKENLKLADSLYKKYKSKLILPIDVRVTKKISQKSKTKTYRLFELNQLKNKNWHIIDIGPKTQIYYESIINSAQTIVANGPMGLFEIENFSYGTYFIAQKIAYVAKGPAFGVLGGGETVSVLEKLNLKNWPDFVSTGGGAMLKFLEGKVLPGLRPLIKK